MSRLRNRTIFLFAFIVLSFAVSTINAATLVVGANNDLSRYPFGRDAGAASAAFPDFGNGGVYQQVYSGTAFAGPVTITQIAFASKSNLTSGPGLATYNINVGLSTSAVAPGGLSTNFAANRGADFAQVFSGVRLAPITANEQFDVVIDIAPFRYDPAQGNLLLDVTFNAPTLFSGGAVLYFNAGFSPATSRAANPSGGDGGAFVDGFGVLTRFTTTEAAQVVLGDLEQTFDGTPKSVSVTTNPPGLAVAVTYDGLATAPVNAGTYAVMAVADDPGFTGQAGGNLIINRAEQAIAFAPLPDRTFGEADFELAATASSGLPVAVVVDGNCALNGTQVHLTGAGPCTVTTSQGGDANFNPAPEVVRTFAIGRAAQVITFAVLPDRTFGDADFGVDATASSNLAVSFAAAGNCTVVGPIVHLAAAGNCTITATQDGDANHNSAAAVARTFTIAKADQQITFDALPDRVFGDADFNVSATASSGLAVNFAAAGNCTIAGATVHLTEAGNCTITATQDGDANYNAANAEARTFAIAKADQQITFDALPDRTFGEADFNVSGRASSQLPLTWTAADNCTVTGRTVHLTGAGSCSITASQPGDVNHNPAAPVTRTFVIARAGQLIVFDALPNRTFRDADFDVAATASSNLPVSFAAAGNCTINGATIHLTGAGTCTVTASQEGDVNFEPAPAVERTFALAKADQQITFDALPDRTFGEVDFNVSGRATSNLPLVWSAANNCAVTGRTVHLTGAGPCTIKAEQPGDANNNAAVPVERSFNIAQSVSTVAVTSSVNPSNLGQTVTFTATVNSAAGTPTGSVQFRIDGVVDGMPVLNANGVATISTSALTAGEHSVVAIYGGDANFATSTGALTGGQVVVGPQLLISISDAAVAEGGVGTRDANFTVSLSQPAEIPVVVLYRTAASTAVAALDYLPIPAGTLTIPVGATSGTITVRVKGDALFEGNEQFFVDITGSNVGGAIDDHGVGTIVDDDVHTSDFDGDGVTDAVIWGADSVWSSINSSDGQPRTGPGWGHRAEPLDDIAVPGDYDGDGISDFAVWRPADGNWYILESSTNAQVVRNWGLRGDIPVPDDYDGDGKTDIAVWRSAEGNWYIVNSSDNATNTVNWGFGGLGDLPVHGHFGGTNGADYAVFRRPEGNWYILSNDRTTTRVEHWGLNGDVLVPGDYDGDGKTDIAVWRRPEGNWFIHRSSDNTVVTQNWGQGPLSDVPVPADYDGDGKTDIAVWRASEGTWYILGSGNGAPFTYHLGLPDDVPVPAAHLLH